MAVSLTDINPGDKIVAPNGREWTVVEVNIFDLITLEDERARESPPEDFAVIETNERGLPLQAWQNSKELSYFEKV